MHHPAEGIILVAIARGVSHVGWVDDLHECWVEVSDAVWERDGCESIGEIWQIRDRCVISLYVGGSRELRSDSNW
jgi:hypothetical protein